MEFNFQVLCMEASTCGHKVGFGVNGGARLWDVNSGVDSKVLTRCATASLSNPSPSTGIEPMGEAPLAAAPTSTEQTAPPPLPASPRHCSGAASLWAQLRVELLATAPGELDGEERLLGGGSCRCFVHSDASCGSAGGRTTNRSVTLTTRCPSPGGHSHRTLPWCHAHHAWGLTCSKSDVVSLAVSPRGQLLLCGHRNGTLTTLDLRDPQPCSTQPDALPRSVCRCRLRPYPELSGVVVVRMMSIELGLVHNQRPELNSGMCFLSGAETTSRVRT